MRRLASQPRSVRYGIPRRMRAQHQTTMTVQRPEIEPWHEAINLEIIPIGAEFKNEFKKFNLN